MGVKQIAITVAIAVLFTTFVLVTIDAFYEMPDWNDYCGQVYERKFSEPMPVVATTPVNCTDPLEESKNDCIDNRGDVVYKYDEKGCSQFKECDYCNRDFNEAEKRYFSNFFLIIAPFGALAIILGAYYKVEFIGSGFMFSGVILMFYATVRRFEDLNKFLKILVIGLELGLVMFIAYKKVIPKEEITKSKKRSKK